MPMPLPWRPERGAAQSYEKIREQARIQVQGRAEQKVVYEPLPDRAWIRSGIPTDPVPWRHISRFGRRPIPISLTGTGEKRRRFGGSTSV
jgi:hypothetical protein